MQYLYIHNSLGKLSKFTTLVGYTCLVNVLTEVVVVSFVDSICFILLNCTYLLDTS